MQYLSSNHLIPKRYCLNSWYQALMLRIIFPINSALMYFRHIQNLVQKCIQKTRRSLLRSLLSATIIFELNFVCVCFCIKKKKNDASVCYIKNILNEDGTLMIFKCVRKKYDINTNYMTVIGCVQAAETYILKT